MMKKYYKKCLLSCILAVSLLCGRYGRGGKRRGRCAAGYGKRIGAGGKGLFCSTGF